MITPGCYGVKCCLSLTYNNKNKKKIISALKPNAKNLLLVSYNTNDQLLTFCWTAFLTRSHILYITHFHNECSDHIIIILHISPKTCVRMTILIGCLARRLLLTWANNVSVAKKKINQCPFIEILFFFCQFYIKINIRMLFMLIVNHCSYLFMSSSFSHGTLQKNTTKVLI